MRGLFRRLYASLEGFWKKNHRSIIMTSLVLMFFVAFFWHNIFISIMPGEKGVLWKRLGDGD